jgi:hypothetical protein
VMWTELIYLLFLATSTFCEFFCGECRNILPHCYRSGTAQHNSETSSTSRISSSVYHRSDSINKESKLNIGICWNVNMRGYIRLYKST